MLMQWLSWKRKSFRQTLVPLFRMLVGSLSVEELQPLREFEPECFVELLDFISDVQEPEIYS